MLSIHNVQSVSQSVSQLPTPSDKTKDATNKSYTSCWLDCWMVGCVTDTQTNIMTKLACVISSCAYLWCLERKPRSSTIPCVPFGAGPRTVLQRRQSKTTHGFIDDDESQDTTIKLQGSTPRQSSTYSKTKRRHAASFGSPPPKNPPWVRDAVVGKTGRLASP